MEKFYLTTAIAYASSKPNFGNTYEIIMSDAFARFQKRLGKDVFLCTGTDEHGQKIEDLAKDAGISPKEYVDRVAAEIKGIWDLMGVEYDHFIRTTDDYHERVVAKIFKKFYDKGDIYKGFYEGWYCTPCESFFTETQVVDGKCPDCGREVKQAREEAYFFKMSKYADRLIKHIEDNPGFIEPESRKKEMVNNFLKVGLQDLCVSRTSFKWGIPVDFDDKHVVYVWLDALTNYITALGYDPDRSYEEQDEKFKKYWPADVHIIGKDILRFHTIYWPIFLMALELPLPKKVFGHPWFNFGNDKMSKSKGNVVYADELAEVFGVDAVRYYALSEMPYNSDGSITYESVIARYNNDLANNLGNLVSRTHAMTKKYFGGVVPAPEVREPLDEELYAAVREGIDRSLSLMGEYRVADSLEAIFTMLRRANKYIDETMPWVLAKSEETRGRLATVIYNLLEVIRVAAVLLVPYIPTTSKNIFSQLGTDKTELVTVSSFGALEAGKPLGEAFTLFQRIDEKKFLEEMEEKAKSALEANKPIPEPEHEAEIGIESFAAVELRVAEIISAEPIPKAKKLLRLQVDLGYEKRQIVSGIARFYTPDQLVGKKVCIVCNLKPAKLCGVDSFGMLLASGEDEIKVVFLDPSAKNGDRIH
nr:methionine--tRNA ligase [Clostridia bacterium]